MSLFNPKKQKNQEPPDPLSHHANMLSEHYQSVVVIVCEKVEDGVNLRMTFRGSPFEAYGSIARTFEKLPEMLFDNDEIT